MTTFEKTWIQQVNTSVDNSSVEGTRSKILFMLKDMLVASGAGQWSVEQSCNGVAFANNATYAWTSAAHVIFGSTGVWHASDGSCAAGDSHSWCVLKSPDDYPTSGKNIYLTIDVGNHDVDENTGGRCQFFISTAAPGTDGAVNHRPTLTPDNTYAWHNWKDQYGGNRGQTNNAEASYQSVYYGQRLDGMVFDPGYDASHVSYFHGARSNGSGSLVAGCFFFMCSREGYGWMPGGGFLSTLASPRAAAADAWPLVASFGNMIVTPGFFDSPSDEYSDASGGWNIGGQYSNDRGADRIRVFDTDGTIIGGQNLYTDHYIATLAGTGGSWYEYQGSSGSAVDSKLEAVPLWVISTNYGRDGIVGRIYDIKCGGTPATVAQGTVEPSSGDVQSVYIGGLWFPLDAVPTL